jgi:hypothetical protein
LRRRRGTTDGTHRATNQRARSRAAPATGDPANSRAGAGAQQSAAHRTLPRIIRISAGGHGQRDAKRGNNRHEQSHQSRTSFASKETPNDGSWQRLGASVHKRVNLRGSLQL